MLAALLGRAEARKHAGELLDATVVVDRVDVRRRPVSCHHEVSVAECSDLWKMCHAYDLLALRQCAQLASHRQGGLSPDTSIHLVECDEGIAMGACGEGEGEHQARQLPPGCNGRSRARRELGIG